MVACPKAEKLGLSIAKETTSYRQPVHSPIKIVKLNPVFSSTGEDVFLNYFTLRREVERFTKYAIDFNLF